MVIELPSMVVQQDSDVVPVLVASATLFVSAFVLGAIMQNWDVALLRPSSPADKNIILGDTTTVAYLIIGFFHFGGMLGGLVMGVGALLSVGFGQVSGAYIRAFLVGVALPMSYLITFIVWVSYTLPSFGWVWDLDRVDRGWLTWSVAWAVLFGYLMLRFAIDSLATAL